MSKLISKHITKEIAIPFTVTMLVLIMTMLLGKIFSILELMIMHGVEVNFIIRFIGSIIPTFLIYITPASFLVATLICITKLSSDNEITAMKASGIPMSAIVRPTVIFSVVVFIFSLWVNLYAYPWGNHNVKTLVYELIRTKATAAINERTFYDNFKDSVIYIDSIPNPSSKSPVLENVFISDISDEDMVNIIYAKTGEFISAPDGGSTYLKLNNGELHTKSAGTKNYNIISFNSYLLHLKLGDESARQKHISSREMYPGALKKRIDDWERRRIPNSQLKIELHNRFSLPASVIVFAIIAIPLGIQRVRSPKLTGFALAIAVLIFNYILVKIFEVLGDNGLINHIVAAWAPNALLLIIGILALMSAAKDKQVKVIVWTEKNTVAIIKIFGKLAGIFIRKKHKRK